MIRGLDPWPTAFSYLHGKKLQLFRPEVVYHSSKQPPGTVLRADREGILIATEDQCLLIREIKSEGKRRMTVEAYLNGHDIPVGSVLESGEE